MRALRKAGWTRARVLVGGWAAWRAAGLPVEPKPPELAAEGEEVPGGSAV
ncbi:MAG TPA: hypothetical protein VF041_14545 [Gemmatimonadaceae bacterium]